MIPSLLEGLRVWTPELLLCVGAAATILIGAWRRRPALVVFVAWLTLLAAGTALWAIQPTALPQVFFGLITIDAFSTVFRWLALGVAGLTVLLVTGSPDVDQAWWGECLGLVLCVGVGLMLMAEATHLLMAYLSIELVSLSSYCLVALSRDARASEAALKYLLFGALASGIMLFGMSWIIGITGQLSFTMIQQAVGALDPKTHGALLLAAVLVLAGLAFKISMVPFHMWTPDAYEGAPIPVAAMLSVGPKAAGLALLVRVLQAIGPVWESLGSLFVILTVLTMTLGNVVAIAQQNIKRLLAYSTIGQVGYVLIGVSVHTPEGLLALVVYLVAYLFMNLGAFACVVAVCRDAKSESLEAFRGLAHRAPVVACCLAVFLLSLAGIPPLLGFLGKFLLFGAALHAHHAGLAVAGIVNSAIALYYYVKIIKQMYLEAPVSHQRLALTPALRLALVLCGLGTVGLGLWPGPLLAAVGIHLPLGLL